MLEIGICKYCLSKSSQVSDQEFDLDHVKDNVVINKESDSPCFSMVIARGSQNHWTSKTCPCAGGTIP